MTTSNSLSIFYQWLFTEPSCHSPNRTIILHGNPSIFCDHLVEQIADYLNEYDDNNAGRWLAATSGLVMQVSRDEHLRGLLGMGNPCPNCLPTSSCGIRKTLTSLGQRGHVILPASNPPDRKLVLPHAFHAGIGNPPGRAVKCHLVLDPSLMDPGSLAHIIGDVYLEWLHRGLRRIPCGSK